MYEVLTYTNKTCVWSLLVYEPALTYTCRLRPYTPVGTNKTIEDKDGKIKLTYFNIEGVAEGGRTSANGPSSVCGAERNFFFSRLPHTKWQSGSMW